MSSKLLRQRIADRLAVTGIAIEDGQVDQLSAYFGLLAKWNRKLNLTALPLETGADEAIDRLLIEPILAAKLVLFTDTLLVDLGSGGGSPAIPLKISAPWLRLVLVESKARKSAFLREVSRELGLSQLEVANTRFEELHTHEDLLHSTSIVSLRAIKADRQLWDCVALLLAPTGRVFWFRTPAPDDHLPGQGLVRDASLPLPGPSELVVFRRTG